MGSLEKGDDGRNTERHDVIPHVYFWDMSGTLKNMI